MAGITRQKLENYGVTLPEEASESVLNDVLEAIETSECFGNEKEFLATDPKCISCTLSSGCRFTAKKKKIS